MYTFIYTFFLHRVNTCSTTMYTYIRVHVYKCNKIYMYAKQHSTPKAVTFPKKNELLQVGLKPTTLYTLDRVRALRLSYQGSTAGWAQISHLIVHLMNRLTIKYMYMYNVMLLYYIYINVTFTCKMYVHSQQITTSVCYNYFIHVSASGKPG